MSLICIGDILSSFYFYNNYIKDLVNICVTVIKINIFELMVTVKLNLVN